MLTDGTDTWYFSTKSFELHGSDITVHDGVKDFGPISHSIDPYTMRYEFANVRVQLTGTWSRRNSDGTWGTIADLVRKAWNRTAQIRWHVGGISISSSLLIFDGTVANIEYTDDGSIDMTLDEREAIKHRVLPQRRFDKTTFPNLPNETDNVPMPLVYGSYTEGIVHRQTGFTIAEKIEGGNDPKYLVCDHVADFIDFPWFYIRALDSWAKIFVGATGTEDDGGRGTVTIDTSAAKFNVYMYPGNGVTTSTGTDGSNTPGPPAAWDNDENSKVSVLANGTTEAIIEFEWTQQGDSTNDKLENSVAEILDGDANAIGIEITATLGGGISVSSSNLEIYNSNTAAWESFETSFSTGGANNFYEITSVEYPWVSATEGVFWHLGSGMVGGDGTPVRIRARLVGTGWTANTTVVAYIHEIRLKIIAQFPRQFISQAKKSKRRAGLAIDGGPRLVPFWNPQSRPFEDVANGWNRAYITDFDGTIDNLCVEVQGREYGSWIDNVGRSNSFSAGQVIERPVFQVESILRDELGMTNTNIDQNSFDAAHSSVGANVSHIAIRAGSALNSKDLVEKVCYEHGFFLFRTHEGKIKAVNYLGTGDLVATLEPTDLISGLPVVRLSNINRIANDIEVFHTRLAHDNAYMRSTSSTDSASIAAYGGSGAVPIPIQINLETVRNNTLGGLDSSQRLIDRLIDVERLLSRPHRFVKLATVGAKFANGEIGDTLRLNATSFDPVMKCMGDTWSGLDLMIISKEMTERGVTFDTIIWAAPTI